MPVPPKALKEYQGEGIEAEKRAGMTEERNFLEPDADHCQECWDEAAKGWSPLGTLIPIGERTCLTKCQCKFEYRRMELLADSADNS